MKKEVVLITGCSSGIGRELAEKLKKKGYIVIATARNLDKISTVNADLLLKVDVTDELEIKTAVDKVIKKYGRIDILINNAGYSVRAAVEEIDINQMQQMFNVNVFGIVRMIQAVAPYMRKCKKGRIINIGSVSGRLSGPVNSGYCASKHAVNAISETARYELKEFGIEVTVLEPGAMDTVFFTKLSEMSDKKMKNQKSPYYKIYNRDLEYRKRQKRANVASSVKQICRIIKKNHLKTRYTISLSLIYKILIHLPDGMREKIILRFG